MNKRGFTLVELIVTLFIITVVMGAVYFTYIKLLKGFKNESSKVETQIEKLVGTELIRLDLEHIGYGIAKDETSLIINWDLNNKTLTLRSTINNTRQETLGWFYIDCTGLAGCNVNISSLPEKGQSYYVYYIDTPTGGSGKYIGFPITEKVYDNTANGCNVGYCNIVQYNTANGCNVGYCNIVQYALSNINLPNYCNVNTYNLLRRVGTEAINGNGGNPLFNCVADYTVTFDLDTDGNGGVDQYGYSLPAVDKNGGVDQYGYSLPAVDKNGDGIDNDEISGIDNDEIRTQLKRINFYILIQEGIRNPKHNFSNVRSCGANTCINGIDVDLVLPDNYQPYSWKVLKISVKPMDL